MVSNITQIQLNTRGYLDVLDNVPLPITMSISQIQDISKKTGFFSKTIRLAGTANNHNILTQIFDINTIDGSFDQSVKEECTIIQNGVPILSGFFRLIDVIKTAPSQGNPDEQIVYEAEVKGDSSDLFSSIGDKYLTDLQNFRQYNHVYSTDNVLNTRGFTWRNGYKYHLHYNTKPTYELTDFTPSIFSKVYFDAIISEAGFTYEWDSLTDTKFDKTIVPYNGDAPLVDQSLNNLRAGFNSAGDILAYNLNNDLDYTNKRLMKFNQTTFLPPLQNPANNYSPSTGFWTAPFSGDVVVKTKYFWQSYVYCPVPVWITYSYGNSGTFTRTMAHYVGDASTNTYYYSTNSTFYRQSTKVLKGSPLALTAGNNLYISGYTPEFNLIIPVNTGQRLGNYVHCNLRTIGEGNPIDGPVKVRRNGPNGPEIAPGDSLYPQIITYFGPANAGGIINNDRDYFKIEPSGKLQNGQVINMNDFIPKKVKQKDFLKAITTLYNLYITTDPNIPNKIIIKSRNEYYNDGGVKDWSDKHDQTSETKVEYQADVQDKILTFSYKDDKDPYNEDYKTKYDETYGQLSYVFSNGFVQSTKKIGDTLFSATPIEDIPSYDINGVNQNKRLIVPTIQAGVPKNNLRILYDCDWVDGNWGMKVLSNVFGIPYATVRGMSQYPHASHFYPNSINPTDDLNWGKNPFYYYGSYSGLTNNNLYNKYWSRFINQIEKGTLTTTKLRLNATDIANINFADKIWLHDNYYFLNKITDFDANSENGLTTVELISVDDDTIFAPTNDDNSGTLRRTGRFGSVKNKMSKERADSDVDNTYGEDVVYTDVKGYGNIIQAGTTGSIIQGSNNAYASINSILQGNNNQVGTINSIVSGNDSIVSGENVYLFGVSGFSSDTSSLAVIGTNTTYVNSPTIYLGGTGSTIYINGDTGQTLSYLWKSGSTGTTNIVAVTDTTTDATGDYAVAWGINNLASGYASLAGGENAIASGSYSIAFLTGRASGYGSFAMGAAPDFGGPTASGDYSVAWGSDTTASGINAFALNAYTVASGDRSFAIGNGAIANGANSFAGMQATADGTGTFAFGTSQTNAVGDSSIAIGSNAKAIGTQSMALGTGAGSGLSNGNTTANGLYSFAAVGATANGESSIAIGWSGTAVGDYSTVIGSTGATANGYGSFASGFDSIANGDKSFAMGTGAVANGLGATAIGNLSLAGGGYSLAGGNLCVATGETSFAFGVDTFASGNTSVALGVNTQAIGDFSTAIGYGSQATGIYSYAEGNQTIASGETSHAEGYLSIAGGAWSHAAGLQCQALGDNSYAQGYNSKAIGNISHAEGLNNNANGGASHAEGNATNANGDNSHSEGRLTTANGESSHAGGRGAVANAYGEFARTSNDKGQMGIVTWGGVTPNATQVGLSLDGIYTGTERFLIQDDSAYQFKFWAVAMDASGNSKEWEGKALIKAVSGTITLVGDSWTSTYGDGGLSTASIDTGFGTPVGSNGIIEPVVQGIAATNITWFVKGEYTRVTI